MCSSLPFDLWCPSAGIVNDVVMHIQGSAGKNGTRPQHHVGSRYGYSMVNSRYLSVTSGVLGVKHGCLNTGREVGQCVNTPEMDSKGSPTDSPPTAVALEPCYVSANAFVQKAVDSHAFVTSRVGDDSPLCYLARYSIIRHSPLLEKADGLDRPSPSPASPKRIDCR